jgi:hypothetical protein
MSDKPVVQLPVVSFEYPDSTNNDHLKIRYVRVVEANSDYVKGYELENPRSQKDGKFKQFSTNRIVHNGVSLISF